MDQEATRAPSAKFRRSVREGGEPTFDCRTVTERWSLARTRRDRNTPSHEHFFGAPSWRRRCLPRGMVPAAAIFGRDHILGPAAAVVSLVEYGDYECPFCAESHRTIKRIQQDLGRRLAFAYRHFPLTTMHPHAFRAAEAAEAAAAQGRFWEMHDLLYENRDALEEGDLVQYADALDLDVRRFRSELGDHTHATRIREDVASGTRHGVHGTPTFFINNEPYNGPHDFGALHAALEAVLASSSWRRSSGLH